ncbi:hypothetical protein K435DRAFT_700737 [Dendrothele bispora CBS 962.96]|uniref:Uncharacterized protein n=1 Tax=Dendrothele bispora (strain CBS 962.96) TaxID=1314807 RepID=A0A4S8KR64_DENBC|nr:hypothetical protein K435DRAFT_700737 [Dendrothele bispora CBS 962.96]
MGPNTNVYSSSTLKLVNRLPNLLENGANWSDYKACVINHASSKGLQRHLTGTARKPKDEMKDGVWYKKIPGDPDDLIGSTLLRMTDDDGDALDEKWEEYHKQEALTHEFIYETIPKSIFVKVWDLPTAAAVWSQIVSTFEDRGTLIASDVLTRLQNIRFTEGQDLRVHLTTMKELQESLAQLGHPVDDLIFVTNIIRSLSDAPSYKPVLTPHLTRCCPSSSTFLSPASKTNTTNRS